MNNKILFLSILMLLVITPLVVAKQEGEIQIITNNASWKEYQALSENFTIDIKDKKNANSEICFHSKDKNKTKAKDFEVDVKDKDKTKDKDKNKDKDKDKEKIIISAKKEKDKNVEDLLKDTDIYCIDATNYREIKFNPTIVYQNDSMVNYKEGNIDVNVTLRKWNGIDFIQSPDDIWIRETTKAFKFGANDTVAKEDSRYQYVWNANVDINIDSQGYYINEELRNRTYLDFSDVCKLENNCSIFLSDDKRMLELNFTGIYNSTLDMVFIDPEIETSYFNKRKKVIYSLTDYDVKIATARDSRNYEFNLTEVNGLINISVCPILFDNSEEYSFGKYIGVGNKSLYNYTECFDKLLSKKELNGFDGLPGVFFTIISPEEEYKYELVKQGKLSLLLNAINNYKEIGERFESALKRWVSNGETI